MTTRTSITEGWPGSPTITASGDTSVLIRNTDVEKVLYWATTTDDTAPSFAVNDGHIILPAWTREGSQQGFDLKDTERLWLASASGTMTVTVTTGDA